MSYFKSIWGDYFFSFLVLVIGLIGSFSLSWSYQQNWQERVERDFREAATDRIEIIRGELKNNATILNTLGSFFVASQDVTHDEFVTFTAPLLADVPFITGVSWIPVVTHSERADFEAQARTWVSEFNIREKTPEGELIVSPQRDTYLPLYYSEPQRSTTYLGYDYSTDEVRKNALEQARITRNPVVTEKITLLNGGENAVLFIHPVHFRNNPTGKLQGYVLSAVPLAKLIASAIEPLKPAGVNILIHDHSVIDDSNQLMYVRSSRLQRFSDEEIISAYAAREGYIENALINVAGRQWQVTVQAAKGYYAAGVPRMSYGILAAGILLSLMIFMFMFSRVRENQRIGRKVTERTRELQQAKSKIETILFSTRDGIIGLDKKSNITFCNPTAANLLGYMKRDLLGRNYRALIAHSREDGQLYDEKETAIAHAFKNAEAITVTDEVMWKQDNSPLQAEYTVSPILDNNDVEGVVITFRDVAERREMEKKLEKMARFDQLTNLANRALFMEQLKKAISRAKRTNKKVGVVYVDLNNFKPINDTLGHAAGDLILKEFAERLNQSSREYDMPARLGGDEFTVLVDNLDEKEGCFRLIERLRENLKAPVIVDGKEIQMSGSMGAAFFPDDSQDHDELVSHADSAMYIAKKDKSLPYAVYKKDGL
jgi:diguanylate cyclase (GGDEF)-like protein/PAS domain S-box-containing protein